MAAGRPTVLAIDGVIRQVIEAADGGIFVPPGDPHLLAAAIERLEADRATAKSMGLNARRYVEQYFNRDRQANQLVKLIERLAAGESGEADDSQEETDPAEPMSINIFQQGRRTSA
jgi:glycosyltransferase involved in cell wall biosynthesis